jgi:hypothetical protein
MNINENDQHSPPSTFLLPTPCLSSEESDSKSEDTNDNSNNPTSKLIVEYPASPPSHNTMNNLIVEYPPPPLHPNPDPIITTAAAANAGIPCLPAVDARVFFSDAAIDSTGIPSVSTIPPVTYNLDGFTLHLKNNNKKSVQYWCNKRRNESGDCKVEVCLQTSRLEGNDSLLQVLSKNGVDTGTYDYLEKGNLSRTTWEMMEMIPRSSSTLPISPSRMR